eukprot:3711960-Rhodomonas_salina.2
MQHQTSPPHPSASSPHPSTSSPHPHHRIPQPEPRTCDLDACAWSSNPHAHGRPLRAHRIASRSREGAHGDLPGLAQRVV